MTSADKAAFVAFVAAAGEVNPAVLPSLVDNAVALVMLYEADQLIGTAAIKTPLAAHHVGEFVKANAQAKAASYPVELGWVVVHPDWRGRGLGRKLVGEAVKLAEDRGIYATTKTAQMLAILEENAFAPVGDPYPSVLVPDTSLTLLARCARVI
jgi:GNAT superfamily N-acetyltransferase